MENLGTRCSLISASRGRRRNYWLNTIECFWSEEERVADDGHGDGHGQFLVIFLSSKQIAF